MIFRLSTGVALIAKIAINFNNMVKLLLLRRNSVFVAYPLFERTPRLSKFV